MPQYARSFASKGARSEWQECDRHTTHTNCSYISDAFRTRSQRSSPSLALYNCNISIFGVDVAAWIIFHKIVINFLCCKVYAMYFFPLFHLLFLLWNRVFSTSNSTFFRGSLFLDIETVKCFERFAEKRPNLLCNTATVLHFSFLIISVRLFSFRLCVLPFISFSFRYK